MKSPKQRFLDLPLSKSFLQVAAQPDFVAALDYALLQMLHEQGLQAMTPGATDSLMATANNFRVEGARRFIEILTNLPIIKQPPKTTANRDNLEM